MRSIRSVVFQLAVPSLLASALLLTIGACRTSSSRVVLGQQASGWPGFEASGSIDLEASPTWKECAPVAYAYIEHVGDPSRLGEAQRRLFELGAQAELEAAGAPFALFYDDPATTPVAAQRSRACLPIRPDADLPAGLRRAELESRMVAFQQRAGAYTDAPLAIPALMKYLAERGWTLDGPVREVYLVDPGSVSSVDELVCEIQVPWTTGR